VAKILTRSGKILRRSSRVLTASTLDIPSDVLRGLAAEVAGTEAGNLDAPERPALHFDFAAGPLRFRGVEEQQPETVGAAVNGEFDFVFADVNAGFHGGQSTPDSASISIFAASKGRCPAGRGLARVQSVETGAATGRAQSSYYVDRIERRCPRMVTFWLGNCCSSIAPFAD